MAPRPRILRRLSSPNNMDPTALERVGMATPPGRAGVAAASSSRLDELTAIRGLAAMMVVLFHARGSWHPIFASGERFTMLVATGWMWVHFFFVLSGFVMMEAYGRDFADRPRARTCLRFLVTRFGRIYPLHLAMLLAMAAFLALGWMRVVDPPGSFAASVALVQGFTFVPLVWNGPAWSISTEWYTYLLFPFLVPVVARLPAGVQRVGWVVFAVAAAWFFVDVGAPAEGGDAAAQAQGGEEWPPGRLLLCAIEFVLGCLTHRLVRSGAWPRARHPGLATAVVVAPVVLMALPAPFDGGWLHAAVAVSFAMSIGAIAADRTLVDDLLASRPLQFLGVVSYSIYLDHEILYSLAQTVADRWTGRPYALHDLPTAWALAWFPVYLAVLMLVSWATYRWIEEPLRQWFKRRARQIT